MDGAPVGGRGEGQTGHLGAGCESLPVWGIGEQRRPLEWGIRIQFVSEMVNTSRGELHYLNPKQ